MRTRVFSRPGTHHAQRTTALLQKAALAALLFNIPSALAVTDTYTGTDGGNWSVAANWTAPGNVHAVPVIGDAAVLTGNATISSVNFNVNYSGAGLNYVMLDSPGNGAMTLKQTTASTMIATDEYIGYSTHGNSYTQSAGTNSAGDLIIGNAANATGNYTLSGAAGVTLTIGFAELLGVSGSGTFLQTGGSAAIGAGSAVNSGGLYVGFNAGSSGSYTLSGGTLIAATNGPAFNVSESIGESGTGNFTQSGGTHTVGTPALKQTLFIGDQPTALGTYTMNNAAATLYRQRHRTCRRLRHRHRKQRHAHPVRRGLQPERRQSYRHRLSHHWLSRRLHRLLHPQWRKSLRRN